MKTLLAIFLLATPCFASETVTKINNTTAKVIISSVNEKEGVKTTISQEKNFTMEELTSAKSAAETSLKSWEDAKKKSDENISIQKEQIALWERLIKEAEKQGVKAVETATIQNP